MAETKKKSKAKASKSKSRSSGKAKSKGAAKAKSASPKKAAAKPKAPAEANGKERTPAKAKANDKERAVARAKDAPELGPGASVALAGQAALAGSKAAGQAARVVASKARIPIVAGGGLVAGVAGGLALMRRRNGHHAPQATLDVDKLISAARRAGSFGEELGRLASLMEQAGGGKRK